MAEILVLDVCARRLPAAGDLFLRVSWSPGDAWHTLGFPPVSMFYGIDFSVARPCSCAAAFSLIGAMACIVIGGQFLL